MPDESTASEEHAILQEVTAPLATLPEDSLPAVSDVEFPIVLRGYDRLAVDAYVKRTTQLVAELQATRSPEAAVRRGLERVGEEVSGILQRAHDAASQITAHSRSEAEDRLERARQEATRITAEAERRLQELDTETDRIWAERQRIVEDAQQLARQLLSLAHSAAARFPADDDPDTTQEKPSRMTGVVVPLESSDAPGVLETPDDPRGGEAHHGGEGTGAAEIPPGAEAASEEKIHAEEEPEADGLLSTEETPQGIPGAAEADGFDHPGEDPDDPGVTRVMPPITPSDGSEQY
jgi:vacuolar-type H+-ATPase subunit H